MNSNFMKVLFFGTIGYFVYKMYTESNEDVGIADKEGKTESDFPESKIKAGTDVEMEHTQNREHAKKIAMDHLTEDEDYYEKLATIEKKNPCHKKRKKKK
jgi:hypothetical protein